MQYDGALGYLNADQIKLYRLIYNRFLASQMKPAEFETASVELSGGQYTFRASATVTTFRGFMAAYGDERESEPAAIPSQPAGSEQAPKAMNPPIASPASANRAGAASSSRRAIPAMVSSLW